MDKTQYLDDVFVNGFVDYFYEIISEREALNYSYTIRQKAWLKWANDNNYAAADGKITYEKWGDLLEKYYWAGSGYQENKEILDEIILKIRLGIASGNDKAFVESTRILEWGQTYKGSIAWLLSQYDDGVLSEKIREAVAILDGDKWAEPEKHRFDSGDLQMDSGLTKIYSLASSRSIIYDGRVAAALAYLVVSYLKQVVPELEKIPVKLNFAVDKAKRDAQGEVMRSIKYKKYIFRNKTNKLAQAESNMWANWIISSIVEKARKEKNMGRKIFNEEINDNNYSQCIRKIEAALFMMGSRIDGI